MSGITPFADIKSVLPAEKVLGHYLGPSRHHTWSCPFHEDKTPSLSAHGPAIRCFGCHWAGDIFRFVQEHQGVSIGDALRICADLAGIVLPDRIPVDRDGPRRRFPSLAQSHAGVLQETAAIEEAIFHEAQKAAAMAWRKAWGARGSEKVWDAVEIGMALDHEIAVMEMGAAYDG